jgi:Fibronectin type III domain
VTPATLPGLPTGVTAIPYAVSAQVSWLPPSTNGGATITAYTVTSVAGGFTCATSGATTCLVIGLTNGQSYQFVVTATNRVGTGSPSLPSGPVSPASVPGPAAGVVGTPGAGSVAVAWTAPADLGGGIFSGYVATATPGGQSCSTTSTGCTVGGLTNGQSYSFRVVASNSLGAGMPTDPSAPVTPRTVPNKPTGVTAVSTDSAATVSWIAPVFNGGATISSFTVTSSPDGKTCTTSTLNCVVTGLADHTPYEFTVSAVNVAGAGAPSDPSAWVTPLSGATYFPLTPSRLLDTRYGTGLSGAFNSHVARTLVVTGGLVPANATAVTGNLTVTGQTSLGYLYIGPNAADNPTSSTLNFPLGDDRANAVTVTLGAGGTLSITYAAPTLAATAQVIFDVTGYFAV